MYLNTLNLPDDVPVTANNEPLKLYTGLFTLQIVLFFVLWLSGADAWKRFDGMFCVAWRYYLRPLL